MRERCSRREREQVKKREKQKERERETERERQRDTKRERERERERERGAQSLQITEEEDVSHTAKQQNDVLSLRDNFCQGNSFSKKNNENA